VTGSARRWLARWRRPEPVAPLPTIFHVTHWKAGSQWLNKIINRCAGDRVVFADADTGQLLSRPLLPGRVYTTCYVTCQEFHSVSLPEPWHRFIVIRDLRDTVVSLYFSLRYSHVPDAKIVVKRQRLNAMDIEDGLLLLIESDDQLPACAAIQRTWLESGEELIRYEDLLARDLEILEPLLTRTCPLGVPAEQVREAVLACRFEALTGGRARGQEDVRAHERKGVAGDWRNHFTGRVTRAFKARFGELLVATGYEKDLRW
jgi:lipopolysaccharide transport system ATP-binding protein